MSNETHSIENQSLENLLNNAIDLTDGNATYVTNVRFRMSNNDLTLDLYRVSPNPKKPQENVAYLLHRVIIPPGLAKNTGNILVNMAVQWEDTFGISLPIVPADIEVDEDET